MKNGDNKEFLETKAAIGAAAANVRTVRYLLVSLRCGERPELGVAAFTSRTTAMSVHVLT